MLSPHDKIDFLISYNTAKEEILEYFEKYKEADLLEVSESLKLDIELTNKIFTELINEGRLGCINDKNLH
jgi:hypothetical protein